LSFKTWLFGYPIHSPNQEHAELLQLQAEVRQRVPGTLLEQPPADLITAITTTIVEDAGSHLPALIRDRVRRIVDALFHDDLLFRIIDFDSQGGLNLDVSLAVAARKHLRLQRKFLERSDSVIGAWRDAVSGILLPIIEALPQSVRETEEPPKDALSAPLIELTHAPAQLIENTFFNAVYGGSPEIEEFGLLSSLKHNLNRNLERASGFIPGRPSTKQLVHPTQAKGKSPTDLVAEYLGGTPFTELLLTPMPFEVPFHTRFEHTHIVGGTGHGKTQLLQLMIYRDLLKAAEGKGSVVVIDSQGDLIRTISHLALFDPNQPGSLADKLVLIDPDDVAYPPSLNLFDLEMGDLERYDAADREKLLNGTIALYEYIFGALLGAELTNKQGVIFRYLARLMMVIPGATIHTLIELMEDGEPFRPYMAALDGSARRFFETQFFTSTFDDTKRQVLHRLWGVLSNPTLDRMFSHPRNKVDLFEAMNSGKIVLINTAKDLLKSDGCQLFGRFFISLIAQAALQRAAIPEDRRRSTFVFVDEAHEYFDDTIDELLNQARKFKVGLVLAHQNLEQLSEHLRATIMASTSIKFAGGVSARDAAAFAKEMRCDPEFVQGMRKHGNATEFACWIKNTTPQAIRIDVPFGVVSCRPALDQAAYSSLIAANRARYCAPAMEADRAEARPATKTPPPSKASFELGRPELL
jgi:hypothetical protein